MKNKHLYIGLDVHKNTNEVALAHAGRSGQVLAYGRISNDLHALDQLITKLRKNHPKTKLHFVYEAGPCGFVIYRYLQRKRKNIDCIVVAPSRIPKKSGDKVKTDRRDAMMLAKLHRSGELDAIHVPDPADEAIRDLCRARTDSRQDLQAARFRLKSFLLRNGYKYPLKTAWTTKHMNYLRAAAERNAINMPIQGTAADMIKIAMVKIQDAFAEQALNTRMLLQVARRTGLRPGSG